MEGQPSYWYVARTRHGAELGVRDRLSSLGVECFIPTRTRHGYRGKGMVEEPLLTSLVFLRATKSHALDLIHTFGVKVDYMFDCATHQLMVVRDKDMDDFRRVFPFPWGKGSGSPAECCAA